MANPIFRSQYTAAQIESLIGHGVPIVQNGTWWTWDVATSAYVDTGASAEGAEAWHGIADEFDSTSSYAVGDLVIYNGELYVCTTAHTGAWDATHFAATTVAAQIKDFEDDKSIALGAYPHAVVSGAVASFSDGADNIPVRSLTAQIVPVQSGSGDPSPTNVRPISGWNGAQIVVSPTQDAEDGTTYTVAFPSPPGTVCGGTLTDNGNGTWTLTVTHILADVLWGDVTGETVGTTITRKQFYNAFTAPVVQSGNGCINSVGAPYLSAYDNVSVHYYVAGDGLRVNLFLPNETPDTTRIQITGELVDPQTYTISAESVKTLLGSNNIVADCGDVSVDYRADTTLYIDGKVNAIMAAIAEL